MPFISNLGLAFRNVAENHGEYTALFYPRLHKRITYKELDHLSFVASTGLHNLGCKRGDVVAIFNNKSPEAFAIMLACLRLGVIYTNIDPDSPPQRLCKILSNCTPRIIVNTFNDAEASPANWNECGVCVIPLEKILQASHVACQDLPSLRHIPGSAPAYIMFTSGSTGQPKGVVISHSNVLSFIAWSQEFFDVSSKDVFTNVNPIFFDNSVFDFYTAIFSGAALVPLMPEEVKDPRMTVRLINEAFCTMWFSVPSLLVYLLITRALTPASLPNIRKIAFGGEGFPKPKLKQLFDMFGHRVDLVNVYGPTECTCICSAHTIHPADFENMQDLATLGYLSQNFDGEILSLDASDPNFGELLLLGPHVGLGYYNDPVRTAQCFTQNPRHSQYRDIGYRTGDLVRRDSSGRLHFKGRADLQIKHMGYRIELEEIEAALSTISGVIESAVVYQKLGDGMGQILGFVASNKDVNSEKLVAQVAAIVPAYMVPKRIEVLESLPKNANGKIDRQALLKLKIS